VSITLESAQIPAHFSKRIERGGARHMEGTRIDSTPTGAVARGARVTSSQLTSKRAEK
jgi:hypothetical protein